MQYNAVYQNIHKLIRALCMLKSQKTVKSWFQSTLQNCYIYLCE